MSTYPFPDVTILVEHYPWGKSGVALANDPHDDSTLRRKYIGFTDEDIVRDLLADHPAHHKDNQ